MISCRHCRDTLPDLIGRRLLLAPHPPHPPHPASSSAVIRGSLTHADHQGHDQRFASHTDSGHSFSNCNNNRRKREKSAFVSFCMLLQQEMPAAKAGRKLEWIYEMGKINMPGSRRDTAE